MVEEERKYLKPDTFAKANWQTDILSTVPCVNCMFLLALQLQV